MALETVGADIVRNYTDNFNIKEYIQQVLIPLAFPDIPLNKLNLGFVGVVSEYISQAIEDAHGTASLMMNEAFINKAVLPDSIYAHASLFGLGYSFAVPSTCTFALQLSLEDVIKYSTPVRDSYTQRYILDKDTRLILGDSIYRLDYDIYIDHQFVNGKRVFNIYYNDEETNSISKITTKYIKHQVSSIDWLVLFVDLMEFDRKEDTVSITDNLVTTNSDITLSWSNQLAGLDLVYISPTGQRQPLNLRIKYTKGDVNPFAWYQMQDNNSMTLSFTSAAGFWSPEFNSKIEYCIYSTSGANANFTSYDRRTGVPVKKTGERYSYNADTKMVGLCYSGSTGGMNRGTMEELRDQIILSYNTANVLTTDYDLQLWFENYAQRYGTTAKFFKRRDDPTGTLFSQFIAIKDGTYTYPTNTLNIKVKESEFDYVNQDEDGLDSEFIIKPGHIWAYDDQGGTVERKQVKMVPGSISGMAMITDEVLPQITEQRPFLFVNPFFIKIHRSPTVSLNYSYLLNHTSFPETEPIQSDCFYQFQLAQFSIERTLSAKYNNMYHIEVICVPSVTTDKSLKYVEGVGDEFPVTGNNMRVVMITRAASIGETGYIEMTPKELRTGQSVLYEVDIAVDDNLQNDMMLEIDKTRTKGIRSLIKSGPREGKIYIDSSETSFHFIVLMKDPVKTGMVRLFEDPLFDGYVIANRFRNANRDLTLYQPMSMMRSTIEFTGTDKNYTVSMSLVPFLKYDIPLDDDRMAYFIQAFDAQYRAMKPVLDMLNGNSFLDFKLFNTYGRSSNYYIGPKDNDPVLKNSDILLDNVYVRVKLVISVYDRSLYTQTVNEVMSLVIQSFQVLEQGPENDFHVSSMIQAIAEHPNIRYVRFLGFNNYDANKQSIFQKYKTTDELPEDKLVNLVPEIIRVDEYSIEITEET